MPDLAIEKDIGGRIAGVDEAGRGPWAGPVVAAAVVLDLTRMPSSLLSAIDDSKRLPAGRRAMLFDALSGCAEIGVGRASVAEIDELNILVATMLAMRRAVTALAIVPDAVLVDGNRAPTLSCRVSCVVGGDRISLSVAAASIIAKVTRDRVMADLALRHPGYGWERNAGYGTTEHRTAIQHLGVTPEHRRSFAPIRNILGAAGDRDSKCGLAPKT